MKDIRKYWIEKRNDLVETAERTKESQTVAFALLDTYDKLTIDEKEIVNNVLSEWLISDDNTLRYDACFLVSQRCIKALKGAIEKAIEFSKKRENFETKFEIKKLNRILSELNE